MSWKNLDYHIDRYEREFASRGKAPRDKDWRPVRFAVRDIILAHVVSRFDMHNNIMQVDVFMTYDPDAIVGWGGTKFAALYILSQAYKCGSSMGIRFTTNGGKKKIRIPSSFLALADDYDVFFTPEQVEEGVVTPKRARHLFLALTEFSPEVEKKIMALSLEDKISPERICYMVSHLTYTKEEMEALILGSEYPEHVLLGKITPEEYLLYQDVVLRARDVVLGGMLDRVLRVKEVVDKDGRVVDLEGDDRLINIEYDPRFSAKIYTAKEDVPIPQWIDGDTFTVTDGKRLVVMVRGRDRADFEYYFENDVKALKKLRKEYKSNNTHIFLLVPRDILSLDEKTYRKYKNRLSRLGIKLLVCPDSVSLLDNDVMRRLKECEIMRHDVGTGEDAASEMADTAERTHNTTNIRLVSVPQDLSIGRLELKSLVEQAMYDEVELKRGVNKYNVRSRYHLVCDRMQFLAHQALLDGAEHTKLPQNALDVFAGIWNVGPQEVRDRRLLPCYWTPRHMDNFIKSVSKHRDDECIESVTNYLQKAKKKKLAVIAVQDKYASQGKVSKKKDPTSDHELVDRFQGQFVQDWINDYGDMDMEEVVVKQLWRATSSARRGQANSVNLSEIPHMAITTALHTMVYEHPAKVEHKEITVNIMYTDGSQARPFPLFCLKPRNKNEMREFWKEAPVLTVGQISMRHSDEMDHMIDFYWFRNIVVSQPGMTSAEVDEVSYQHTLEDLHKMEEKDAKRRFQFVQTGFQPTLVGFWRAVTQFLISQQGKPPLIEVIPYFMDQESQTGYSRGPIWH